MANFHDEANGIKTTVGLIQGLIAAVLAGLLLWIGSEITDLGKKIERLEVLYDSQVELMAQRDRLAKLERDQISIRFQGEIDTIKSEVDQLKVSMRQVWPRLRAHGENITAIVAGMNRAHPELKMEIKAPESF